MENSTNQQNNGQGFAIAGLVIGIFALLFSVIPCVGTSAVLIGIVAVVFGTVALTKANTTNAPKGLSIAGISLGGLAIVIAMVWLMFMVGSKNIIKERFQNVFEWADEFEHMDIEIDDNDFEDMESLEELEHALDELEGVIDEVNGEVEGALNEVHGEAKDAINDAKKEIDKAKEEVKKEIKKAKEEAEKAIDDI